MPTQSRQQVTIQDVAKAVGAAKSTVSAAFTGKGRVSPERRAEILDMARTLGFEPNPHAQRLSNGHCNNMVALFSLDLSSGVGIHKLKLIQRLLAMDGYDVPVYSYGSYGGGEVALVAKLMNTLCRQRPRAIVCCTCHFTEDAWDELKRYQEKGGIVVCYDFEVPIACDTVIFDRVDNTRQATRYLLELGHREIGFYSAPSPDLPPSKLRREGFFQTLQEYNLQPREEWLFHEGLGEMGGILTAEKFLRLKRRPSAMCVVNDLVASTFITRLREAGMQVPGEVSVMAHDDTPFARCSAVPLTTMTHPTEEIAHQVVAFLQSRLTEEYTGEPRRAVLRGTLIERQSCAAYPVAKGSGSPESSSNGHRKEVVLCGT